MAHRPGKLLSTWWRKWLPMLVDTTLPVRLLLVFVPVGVPGLTDPRRRVLAAALPLFVVLYAFNPFFLEHYAVVIAPAVLLLVVLGARSVEAAFPERPSIAALTTLLIATCALTNFYEINMLLTPDRYPPRISDETFRSKLLRVVNVELAEVLEKPAVVLFRYRKGDPMWEEPVYNTDTAWPDDAPIIRAHDLGERNKEIIDYYAQRQPERHFYLFDRTAGSITPLGTARALREARGKP